MTPHAIRITDWLAKMGSAFISVIPDASARNVEAMFVTWNREIAFVYARNAVRAVMRVIVVITVSGAATRRRHPRSRARAGASQARYAKMTSAWLSAERAVLVVLLARSAASLPVTSA